MPRPARALLGLLCAPTDRRLVLDDLDERFRELEQARGRRAARRWYWSQTVRALPALLSPGLGAGRTWWWQRLGADGRLGLRALRRRPLYSTGVVGTLALGLGSVAAMFGVVWHVWLAPLPYPEPDRLVRLYELQAPEPGTHAGQLEPGSGRWRLSPPLVHDLRRHEWSTLSAVAGVTGQAFDWARPGRTSRVSAVMATHELFDVLGLAPFLGRPLSADESSLEVVLTRPFWERAFGSDPSVVSGGHMDLNGRRHAVVGVVDLPTGYPDAADVLTRLTFTPQDLVDDMRGARYLDAVARLRPGARVPEAATEMDALVASLAERAPAHRGWGGEAVPLAADLVRPYRGILSLLLAAGLSFLALAVVNVGGLVAARRVAGSRERSVRLALGASEGTLLRSSLVEGLLAGGLGAAAGLLGAYGLMGPIRSLVPEGVPRLDRVGVDPVVGAVVVMVGAAAGLAVGALGYGLSRRAGSPLRPGRTSTVPVSAGRRALVVAQVALTTLLLTGGAAILDHVASLRAVDIGFEPTGVLTSAGVLSEIRYPDDDARRRVWEGLVRELTAAGIEAAVATNPPMAGSTMPFGFRDAPGAEQAFAQYHTVTPGYFRVLGAELLDGRAFSPEDAADAPAVVVVSESLAGSLEGGRVVGRRIQVVGQMRTVVGVVGSTRHFGPDDPVQPEIYVPLAQDPWGFGHVLLRTGRTDAAAQLTSALEAVDPGLALPPPTPYGRYVTEWFAPLRLQLVIVGVLALVGLTLAALGLYALVAYHVTSRRREIGIRMALGAPDGRLFSSVMLGGLGLAAGGLGAGLAGWALARPLLAGLAPGVVGGGLAVPALVVAVVGVVAAAATAVPAWRSTSVEPSVTLAAE